MNEDVVKKICQDISVPKMIKVRQHFVEDNISPQDPGSDRKQRSYKRNDRYRPFTYFHQYHHATIVMGCILGKYPGHSHRIDGNEKGQTGK